MSASYVNTPDGTVADVGCDHAHTGIWLIREGRAGKVIGMDVRKGPLLKAQENIRLYGCEDRIELRLSDGFTGLTPGEAQTIIIAGMGGVLMKDILTRGEKTAAAAQDLVLQPQSHIDEVRGWLASSGFAIKDEDMCFEDGQYYLSMHAAYTGTVQELSEAELMFGPVMIQKKSEVFLRYVEDMYEKALRRLGEIGKSDSEEAAAKADRFTRVRDAAAEILKGR